MSIEFTLNAEFREDAGKGASRRLRRTGKVPAILYGGGQDPRALTLDHDELKQKMQYEAFFSHVITVKVGSEAQECIVKDLQRHPAKPLVTHVDLQRIVAGEAIRMSVPLHFDGEETAPGVKLQGGIFSHHVTEVEVSCLPKDLPEYLELDVSKMEMDDVLHLSDIQLPEGVTLVALSHGDEHDVDEAVVAINRPRVTVEEEPEEAEAAEGEAEAEEKKDEADSEEDKD